ncbi:stalk domain-containing protein [Peptoniphilus mikwangii]|uniref:stalk domain-containing protein n=1 Tax=Peptoniphilus mikwangii TaxID=1354300 RepID=UPI0003F66486|nr:stalk domain-containing protein [Peptoniphilus mikwangii]
MKHFSKKICVGLSLFMFISYFGPVSNVFAEEIENNSDNFTENAEDKLFENRELNSAYADEKKIDESYETYENVDFSIWKVDDFEYEGTTLTGLSDSGRLKIRKNKNLILPNANPDGQSITKIGYRAFGAKKAKYGKGIKSVTFPNTIEIIDEDAFSFNDIKEIKIPASVRIIGKYSFYDCELSKIIFEENSILESIEKKAFKHNRLSDINIPNTLKEIGEEAFEDNPGSSGGKVILYPMDITKPVLVSSNENYIVKSGNSSEPIPNDTEWYRGSAECVRTDEGKVKRSYIVKVRISVKDGKISIVEDDGTEFIGKAYKNEKYYKGALPIFDRYRDKSIEQILNFELTNPRYGEAQNELGIDVVSGSTVSSKTIHNAIRNAIGKVPAPSVPQDDINSVRETAINEINESVGQLKSIVEELRNLVGDSKSKIQNEIEYTKDSVDNLKVELKKAENNINLCDCDKIKSDVKNEIDALETIELINEKKKQILSEISSLKSEIEKNKDALENAVSNLQQNFENDDLYEGEAKCPRFKYLIKLKVRVRDGKVTLVEDNGTNVKGQNLKRYNRSKSLFKLYKDKNKDQILNFELTKKSEPKNELGIDVVSGATYSSRGIHEAMRDAVGKIVEINPEIILAKEILRGYVDSIKESVLKEEGIGTDNNKAAIEAFNEHIELARNLLAKENKDITPEELDKMQKMPTFINSEGKKQKGSFAKLAKEIKADFEVLGERSYQNKDNEKFYTVVKNGEIIIKTAVRDLEQSGNRKLYLNYITETQYNSKGKSDAVSGATPKYEKQEVPLENYTLKNNNNGTYTIKIDKIPSDAVILKPIIKVELANMTSIENGDMVYVKSNDPMPEPLKEYRVNVIGGTGSGQYKKGDKVEISAIDHRFSCWDSNVKLDNKYNSSTFFIMPEYDVSIYAILNERDTKEYKDKTERTNYKNDATIINNVQNKNITSILKIGSKEMTINNNGTIKTITMDVAPYIKNDRTMLSLRYVAEALGYTVTWNKDTRTASFTDGKNICLIQIDGNEMVVNGEKFILDNKPEIVSGRIMLPIASIARALGLSEGIEAIDTNKNIMWNGEERKITISI